MYIIVNACSDRNYYANIYTDTRESSSVDSRSRPINAQSRGLEREHGQGRGKKREL